MSDAFGAIGAVAIGAHPDEQIASGRPLRSRLLAGEEAGTVVILAFTSRPVTAPFEGAAGYAIGDIAIGDERALGGGAGGDELTFAADGMWCGRPDDFGAAHLDAAATLLSLGDVQEEIPYLPEQDRRATTTLATARLMNVDGRYDDFFRRRTVDGQRVRAWLTDTDDGYSAEWVEVLDALAESFDPGVDEASLVLSNVASRLETPALRQRYSGSGRANGDARLRDKYVPVAFGRCFNVEPDLEDFENQIDRWSAGAVNDITAVRDIGAPLSWDGNDWPDYASLFNAPVAPGFFTKATAIGRTKRGATAIGRITGDVEAPLQTTAEILLALARGAANLPDSLIDAASFGVLPTDKVDLFLKGDRAVSVAEVFDALLRPFNAWYGALDRARLAVGIVREPAAASPSFFVDSADIDEPPAVDRPPEPPRWRLGVSGVRNWTPLRPDELADWRENPLLTEAMWQRLQATEEVAVREDTTIIQRNAGAIDGLERFGAVRGYFTEIAGAQAAADALFRFLSRAKRRVSVRTSLKQIATRPGALGAVSLEGRESLMTQAPTVVLRRSFSSEDRAITLSTLATVDGA